MRTKTIGTLLLVIALAGCAGGAPRPSSRTPPTGGVPRLTPVQEALVLRAQLDARRAANTVRDYFASVGARDPRACSEYLDANYLFNAMRLSGAAAVIRCTQALSLSRTSVSLRRVAVLRLAGPWARVQFVVEFDHARVSRDFRLRFIRGRYRIDAQLPPASSHHRRVSSTHSPRG